MRTSFVAALVPLLFGACVAGEISGPGGGGDDTNVSATCGDGVTDANETCDDGNTSSGDGCSSVCATEVAPPTPRLDVTLDKTTVMTELKTSTPITVMLSGANGFGGQVTLTPTVVDANDMPIEGWTVAMNTPTVDVPVDGEAVAVATLVIPSENRALSGTVKIAVASSAGTQTLTSTVTALNQVSIDITLNGNGQCVYPPAGTINVSIGSKLRFVNKGTNNITIHMGNGNGMSHQDDPGSAPNTAYELTLTGTPGGSVGWYCHAPGPTVNNLRIQPVAAAATP